MSTRLSLGLAFAVALLTACDEQPSQPASGAPPPAVTVVVVERKDVTSTQEFVGRVQAVDKVDLRARVSGFLEKRLFQEGESVRAGDLLFVIQSDEFRATVDQRKADLARAEAAKENAQAQLRRAEVLVQKKDIPEATVDERRAADRTATAEILEAKAALEKAELDLGYTEIRAPIGGRIGRAAFTVGNLIGPDSGVLATIVSQDPIYVNFPISQRILLDVRKQNEERVERAKDSAVVRLKLADGSHYPHPGKIDFADIQISQSTDTLAVRAVVANPDGVLIDGQFVTVSVEGDKPEPRIVIPQVAVNADQAGLFVLVVDGENKVEVRRIKPGSGREGQLVVEEGLNEGDRIITEGLQKVRPGQVVRPAAASAAQPKA
jgi:membrane fusion protein (multidrug efflux system)